MKRVLTLVLPFLTVAALSQIGEIDTKPIRGAMQPAISPDGSKIAFRYRGDVWFVAANGGAATRLTDHVELDQRPVWSPDGKWIAFSSDRNGNFDVFAIPAAGGESRQITFSGADEVATDWSPDGNWLVFSGRRDTPWTGIYIVNVRDLRFKRIAEDYMGLSNPKFSPDGNTIVAQRSGFPWTRPRYRGSAAAQVVTIDVKTGAQKRVVDNEKQNLWPTFSPDGNRIYAVTYGDNTPSAPKLGEAPVKFTDSADRTPNLWKFDLSGRGQRITGFVGEQVRTPSVSNTGVIAYEREGNIYTFANGKETKVDIIAYVDSKVNATERKVLTDGATEAVISPDYKTFAFTAASEIWTVPTDKPTGRNKDDAIRLTDYPGVDENPIWSKDGKTIFFVSDRNFNRRLFSMNVETKKTTEIWKQSDDVMSPELSPDGSMLGFWAAGAKGGLYVWNTNGMSEPKRVFDQPGSQFFGTGAGEFAWSPDNKWIALTRRQPGGTWNVWLLSLDSGKAVNITQRNVSHGALAWSADGKYLYFSSSRDGGGYFILPLNPEDEDPQEAELKYEKPKSPVVVKIDFTNVNERIRKLFAQAVSGNVLSDKNNGKLYFLYGDNLWVSEYDGKNVRQIVAGGVGAFTLSEDGKFAYTVRNGVPTKISLENNFPATPIAFRAELVQDANLVRKAAFSEFWRMYNRGFYDANFHGRDWSKIRSRYEPLLEGVGHRREFSELLNMMVGELEGSHSEVGAAPGGTPGSPTIMLPGFNFDYSYEGPGIRVKSLYSEAPGSYKKTQLKPGDYVMQINGQDVRLDENLWKVLHNQGGRDLNLLINSRASKDGARQIRYRAISPGDWSEMRYRQWVAENRKRVEAQSNGKIGYIHIRGMGGGDRQRFEEEFYEYKQGKEAMIIDVRFNGGGNIADSLIDVLERRQHGYYRTRDGYVDAAPNNELFEKPMVVLMNENSYSNAEMFPYAMKQRQLATLIGMPTPGYVIWTWGGRLVDGTSMRMPMSGVYRMDGTPMEDLGQQPDIKVPWTNEDYMAGKDPQLERAISELLKKIK